jgi:SAM-dependent methyltransferase
MTTKTFEMLDKNYWKDRYQAGQTGWDAGAITRPLQAFFQTLPPSVKREKILIPGAGHAHEAAFLHLQGYEQVYICDWAEEPLAHFQELYPDFPKGHLLCADFFALEGQYDWIVEQTFFCAIDPSLRSAYAAKVASLLKPGGRLVGVLFNRSFEHQGPPFGGSEEEYRAYFEPVFAGVNIKPCLDSIEPRQGSEVFIELVKA